jgi:hypothetical protein
MCQRVTCRRCGKPTFAGCGRHVEQVLGDVAPADRCLCRESVAEATAGTTSNEHRWIKTIRDWFQ